MNKTPNYSLNQWEAEDRVLRTDFNADNAKIDAAIQAVAARVTALEPLSFDRFLYGTFTGDGDKERVFPLPWTPRLVIMLGKVNSNQHMGFITPDFCLMGSTVYFSAENAYFPLIQENSIQFRSDWFNVRAAVTYYIALR